MFASIASFFWGSATSAAPTTTPLSPFESANYSSGNFKDDVCNDAITVDNKDDISPVPTQDAVVSTSSLSDEEAGWVFVNNANKAPVEPSASEMESEPSEQEPLPLQKRENEITKPSKNTPSKRTRNIPSSALHSSSVLSALAELKPQQQAERRKRELRINNKQLERSNKVLRVNSSSNKPNKRRSMYTPNLSSRAVNNRKC